ncbi:caskin-1-like [Oncorhynchus clarkii lewisi]|uniref:caskin-1-like n=1 Tax=Oncorhynchus clarkii lewisi TaxID=490388 RepID=UPI0039B842E7
MGKDQELLQAVKTEDLLTVQKLLQRPGKAKLLGSAKRVNVNFQDTDGFAPLHHAALSGNLELISLLLESQATVDIRDQKGMRPLHYAAWQGKAEPMKMLLKSGSSVNGQSDEGQIPLHLSAQHGHYDVSEMLLQHQSNPCIVDNAGKTPLDLACEFGRVGVVQLLLNSNMCVALLELKPGDSTDPNGTSPLHLAAKNGHIDIIRLLIQSGIDINRQTKAGTALHEAALCGKTEAVRLLLDSGINAAVRNTYSQTALDIVYQFSASQASREIKQLLRDASAALQVRALKDYCNNYDLTSLNIKAGDVITVLEQHVDGRWKGCIHDNRTGNDRVGYFPSTIVEVINKRTGLPSTVINTQQFQKIQLVPTPTVAPAISAVVNGNETTFHQFHILPPPPPPPPHTHQPLLPLFTSFGYNRSPVTTPGDTPPTPPGCRGSEATPHGSPTRSCGPQGSSSEEIWVLRKPGPGGDRSSVGSSGSVTSVRSSGSGQSAGSSTHILHAQAEGVKLLATVLSQSAKAKEHLLEQSKSVELSTGSASASRQSSQSGCPLHEAPPYDATATWKGEGQGEGKSSEAVIQWLSDFQLQVYAPNFISAGYDIATISRMTPEDLTAIGVTKPGHRKKMTSEINKLSITEWLPDQKPASLAEWLSAIGLSQYQQVLVQNGYENIDFITDITWEDLQEIGIMKLGHQKKLMLAVKRLAEMQRGSEGRSSPRKKPPPITQQQEVMSIENRPPDNEIVTSPKLCTFQDSELSPELQTALIQPSPEVKGQRTRSLSKDPEEGVGPGGRGGGGGGVPPKKEARTMRQTSQGSQRGSASSKPRPPSHAHSMPAPPYTPPHTPTKKPLHSSTSAPGPSPQAKPKSSPQLIQGERPGSPRSHPLSNAHRGTHNTQTQPGPQPGPQPQPSPQPQPGPQPQHQPTPTPQSQPTSTLQPQPSPQVSVPLLCLPPEAEGGDGGEMGEAGEALLKKRANSLNRYAGSDGEGEERGGGGAGAGTGVAPPGRLAGGGTGKYATVTHRVSRSHSVRNQDKNVNRSQSQSIALRPKKKGPPPPPPKRSSSAISNSNLADTHTPTHTHAADGLLGVPYNPQRRASDLGVSVETVVVDTGSAGSVRSIAAMLEMSSIGGGAKGMAIQRNFLQQRDAIGLDGEVVNRRRTISGPVTELVAAARRDRPTPVPLCTAPQPSPLPSTPQLPSSPRSPSSPHPSSPHPSSPHTPSSGSSAENLPFAAERKQTVKRQRGEGEEEGETEGDGDGLHGDGVFSLPQDELFRVDATATLKRRPRCNKPHPNGSRFTLTESSTVKRRPKSRDKEPEGFSESGIADITGTSKTWTSNTGAVHTGAANTGAVTGPEPGPAVPYENGTATVKRRPVYETGEAEPSPIQATPPLRDSSDLGGPGVVAGGEGGGAVTPVRKPKPPVSPKPVLAQMRRHSSSRKVPLPGPGTPGSPVEAKKIPPPVSPKPAPPPTAPKPTKHLHSITTPTSPPYSSSSPNPNAKPPTPPAQSPHTPLTPQSPHTPLTPTPPPIKPPRSSIGGVSVDMGTVAAVSVVMSEAESVHQKLEETSASLAAALKAVEDKIREEQDWVAEEKTTVSILDDIGSMFDDLADQLDAMLE